MTGQGYSEALNDLPWLSPILVAVAVPGPLLSQVLAGGEALAAPGSVVLLVADSTWCMRAVTRPPASRPAARVTLAVTATSWRSAFSWRRLEIRSGAPW